MKDDGTLKGEQQMDFQFVFKGRGPRSTWFIKVASTHRGAQSPVDLGDAPVFERVVINPSPTSPAADAVLLQPNHPVLGFVVTKPTAKANDVVTKARPV